MPPVQDEQAEPPTDEVEPSELFDWAPKTENILSRRVLLHLGHAGLSDEVRTRYSNSFLHFLHVYSYTGIGINTPLDSSLRSE